jgi:hypothetical protein
MEFAFALASFVALIGAWLVMPGSRKASDVAHAPEALRQTA